MDKITYKTPTGKTIKITHVTQECIDNNLNINKAVDYITVEVDGRSIYGVCGVVDHAEHGKVLSGCGNILVYIDPGMVVDVESMYNSHRASQDAREAKIEKLDREYSAHIHGINNMMTINGRSM